MQTLPLPFTWNTTWHKSNLSDCSEVLLSRIRYFLQKQAYTGLFFIYLNFNVSNKSEKRVALYFKLIKAKGSTEWYDCISFYCCQAIQVQVWIRPAKFNVNCI